MSEVTSPLLAMASRVITSEEEQSSYRKKIKPTKSFCVIYSSSKVRVGGGGVSPRFRLRPSVYTSNLEMLHSSLEKEMDCGGGTQRDSLSLEEIGHSGG